MDAKDATQQLKKNTAQKSKWIKTALKQLGYPRSFDFNMSERLLSSLLSVFHDQPTTTLKHYWGKDGSCALCGVGQEITDGLAGTPLDSPIRPHHDTCPHLHITYLTGWVAGCSLCQELKAWVTERCKPSSQHKGSTAQSRSRR